MPAGAALVQPCLAAGGWRMVTAARRAARSGEGMPQDLLDYESRSQPLAPMQRYVWRVAASFLIAVLLIGGSLLAGMWGYAHFEGMNWLDAFLNAAMILSGMGPADQLRTDAGKLFAGCYALYSGLVIVLVSGIVLAPIVHRILHRFHVDE
jgi:hypothetical protein